MISLYVASPPFATVRRYFNASELLNNKASGKDNEITVISLLPLNLYNSLVESGCLVVSCRGMHYVCNEAHTI